MKFAHWINAHLVGALLLLAAGSATWAARAELVAVGASGAVLVVHGIPIPDGAEPTLAANMSMENLRAFAPKEDSLGKGRLRAVVYDIHGEAPPDDLATFYRKLMTGPVAVRPPSRPGPDPKSEPDERTRVLLLQRGPGYLAIRSQEVSGPARITVALVEGSAAPGAVLKTVEALLDGVEEPQTKPASALLSPQRWEMDATFIGPQVQLLQRHLRAPSSRGNDAPEQVVMRSLLNQAQMLNLKKHRVAPPVTALAVLDACIREARQDGWRLLSIEAVNSKTMMALYRLRDDRGMIMLRAEPGQLLDVTPAGSPISIATPTTLIWRFEVKGRIKLQELFRPTPLRRPSVTTPPVGAPVWGRTQSAPRR